MFSCDVLAVETQSAPLWENVSKQKDESATKKKESKDETEKGGDGVGPTTRKRKLSPPRKQYGWKRNRMMVEYRDCNLCELNFNSELDLEEHLFSILHHRALDTEFGKCRHTCNLCRVVTSDLPGYVEHLRNDKHKSKNDRRKLAIECGKYKRPENSLHAFADSFLCLPARAKQLKNDAELNKKLNQVFPNDWNPKGLAQDGQESYWQDYGYYESNPYYWGQDRFQRRWQQRHHVHPKRGYPDWHPSGSYGMRPDKRNHYRTSGHDYHGVYGFYGNASEENPYEKGWSTTPRENWEHGIYDMEKYVYTREIGRKQKVSGKVNKNSLPPTARRAMDHEGFALPPGGIKSKELLARAQRVIQNGQRVKAKKKKKGKSKTAAQLSLDSSSIGSVSSQVSTGQRVNAKKKNKRKGKTVEQRSFSSSSISSVSSQRSTSFTSTNHTKNGGVPLPPGKGYVKKQQNSKTFLKNDDSATAKYPTSLSVTIDRTTHTADHHSRVVSKSKSSLSIDSSANNLQPVLTKAINPRKVSTTDMSRPTVSRSSEVKGSGAMNKFSRHLNKESGPVRLKNMPLVPKSSSSSEKMSSDAPQENSDSGRKNVQPNFEEPSSLVNIRTKFRKILDEISQPVASPSDIVRKAEEKSTSNGTDTSIAASWAESSFVTGASSNSTNCSRGEAVRPSSTLKSSKSIGDLNSTKYISLARPAGLASDECGPEQRAATGDDATRSFSPMHDYMLLSSDADTPTHKKRSLPQPNLYKARTRITSKLKDSPTAPSKQKDNSSDAAPEARQANLNRLLQKYDKGKKNSPDVNDEIKKAPGPRFGIDLNLQCVELETVDAKALAEKAGHLVEIMPEKRSRSLSENDCTLSFSTDCTAKYASCVFELEPVAINVGGDSHFPFPGTRQRTSTPAGLSLSNAEEMNACLLSMSEREESLHASVRSLAVQETNVQAEIDNKIAALKALQTTVDELNKRKMCLNALKRRHEENLETLRRQRLMLLRGSVPLSSAGVMTTPNNIFQDVIPNQRQITTPSNPDAVLHPLNALLLQQPTTSNASLSTLASYVPAVVNSFDATLPQPQSQTSKVQSSTAVSNTLTTANPSNAKLSRSQFHTNNMSCPAAASKTPGFTLPDFNLSRVKSEPGLGTCDVPLSSSVPSENRTLGNVIVKTEKCDDGYQDFTTQSDSCSSGCVLRSSEQQNQNERSVNAKRKENSTLFFSLDDGTGNTAEVDKILEKYCGKDASLRKSASPRAKKRKNTSLRRSPRNLGKSGKNDSTSKHLRPEAKEPEKDLEKPAEPNDHMKTRGAECELPNRVKTHESPLVGMQIVKEGLITCAQDETVLLHGLKGQRHSVKLGATPTAITTGLVEDVSLLFVAMQKVVMEKQASGDSEVVKRMEHPLNLYTIKNLQGGSYGQDSTMVVSISALKMKSRVLCMHYDKRTLFCGMKDGMAAVVTINAKRQLEQDVNFLECHSHSAITCLTSGNEGPRRILCCGSQDCTVSVRDAKEGLLLRTIQGHTKTVTSLQLVHNELFSASVDRLVLGHELISGKLLHKFSGHSGAVRSLLVVSDILVTLSADRNIRFFDTKTCRLLQKPKEVSSLPLYVAVHVLKNGLASPPPDENSIFIGCEDSTIVRMKIPNTQHPFIKSPAKNCSNSSLNTVSKFSEKFVNLTGDFECKWEGCAGAGTFVTARDLQDHILCVHVDTTALTSVDDHALRVGTCCQWESCTHYFAPELDTVKDIRAHIQRHLEFGDSFPSKVPEAGRPCP